MTHLSQAKQDVEVTDLSTCHIWRTCQAHIRIGHPPSVDLPPLLFRDGRRLRKGQSSELIRDC